MHERASAGRVEALAPGETRALAIILHAPGKAAGTVHYPGGQAAVGILVRLVTPAEEGDSPVSSIHGPTMSSTHSERARHEIAKTVTDGDGAFELVVDSPGRYLVVVGDDDLPRTEALPFDTSTGPAPLDLNLTLDRGGVLEGRVLLPRGIDPVGHDIVFVHAGSALGFSHEIEWSVLPNRQVDVIRGGRFTLGPLTAGPGDP